MLERLGIRTKLVLASVFLAVLAGLVIERLSSAQLDAAMTARMTAELATKAALLDDDLASAEAGGAPVDWDAFADHFGALAAARTTLVTETGRVLGDSEVPPGELGHLENHAARKEVRDAREHGSGSSVRRSPTLGTRMLYVARRHAREGSPISVVRLALPLTEVDAALAHARELLALGTGVALVLAIAMIILATQLLTAPVRAVTKAALAMSDGDLAARAPARGKDEIAELGRTLNRLAGELSASMQELRDERDLLSRILEGMSEGVLVVDGDGRIVLANGALRAMTLVHEGVIGKSVIESIRNASLEEALGASGDEPALREIELGGLLPRRLLVRVSRLGEPGARARIAVFHDVTDLRRLETIRTDFVANVSHELRTPVTAISTAVETLLGGALADPDDAAEFTAVIDRHAQRLRQLVDDLLDLAKIEQKDFRLKLVTRDLGPVVEQSVRLLEEPARKRRVRVRVSVEPELPPAAVDRRALEQVLSNLLDNAIKYGGEGASVRVGARRDGDSVTLTVADDGPGIARVHLERIFERFYRVDAGRSRELGGTGLGLAIVKHLVEQMNGSVEVESEPGRGACFTVRLPIASPE